jgi:uncharacterized protein
VDQQETPDFQKEKANMGSIVKLGRFLLAWLAPTATAIWTARNSSQLGWIAIAVTISIAAACSLRAQWAALLGVVAAIPLAFISVWAVKDLYPLHGVQIFFVSAFVAVASLLLFCQSLAWHRRRWLLLLTAPLGLVVMLHCTVNLKRELDPVTRCSHYLTMRDGTKIAVDLYLPRNLAVGRQLPTIYLQSRYYRGWDIAWPFSLLANPVPTSIRPFVQKGYAYVVSDVRGSGASYGQRVQEWSEDEVRDGSQIVDWIIRQPWSNGKVGATGISYDGTAAEFLLTTGNPAVVAVAPRFALFDTFPEIAFPGGVYQFWFLEHWAAFNHDLDSGNFTHALGKLVPPGMRGVRRTDEDHDGSMRAAAIRDHASNYDLAKFASSVTFRDDADIAGHTLDATSLFPHVAQEQTSGAAIYSYSGWLDGAYASSAVERFRTVHTPGSRLILGPWDHGGQQNISPYAHAQAASFNHTAELLRFFDFYLKGVDTGIGKEAPVKYYTMGEEKWHTAQSWPLPNASTVTLHLAPVHALLDRPAKKIGADTYMADYTATSGIHSRWNSVMNLERNRIGYPDRAEQDKKLLVYTSDVLPQDMEVTGFPVLTLYMSSTATDGLVFAYLEEVDGQSRVHYITEGELHLMDRKVSHQLAPYKTFGPYHTFLRADTAPMKPGKVEKVSFALLPTSFLVRKGYRLRLALAAADRDHFPLIPKEPPTWHVERGLRFDSHIDLPVAPRYKK